MVASLSPLCGPGPLASALALPGSQTLAPPVFPGSEHHCVHTTAPSCSPCCPALSPPSPGLRTHAPAQTSLAICEGGLLGGLFSRWGGPPQGLVHVPVLSRAQNPVALMASVVVLNRSGQCAQPSGCVRLPLPDHSWSPCGRGCLQVT